MRTSLAISYAHCNFMQVRSFLELCRNECDDQGGPLTTDVGEVIMEEGEYQAITQLKKVLYPTGSHCVH